MNAKQTDNRPQQTEPVSPPQQAQQGQAQAVAVVNTPIAQLVAAAKEMGVALPPVAAARGIEAHQWNALKTSIFVGGSDMMVLAAWDYCQARRLDPLKKPVHIVKFWDQEAQGYKEQILEGIASHRTTADRTGKYAGKDPVSFGPDVREKIGDLEMMFPLWAQVTIYKMVDGQRCAFPGTPIYFREFYAAKKGGSPNQQWAKRPRHMLAKCAEAAALREAFPDELGGLPTADEMDGRDDPTPPRPQRADMVIEHEPPTLEVVETPAESETGELFELRNGQGEVAEMLLGPVYIVALDALWRDAVKLGSDQEFSAIYEHNAEQIAELPDDLKEAVRKSYGDHKKAFGKRK